MKKILMTFAAVLCCAMATSMFTACSDRYGETSLTQQPEELSLDGASGYVDLSNAEHTDWKITACPEWMTPVAEQGTALDTIRFYVESNGRTPLREGEITVCYANGRTLSTRAEQTNSLYMRRSYATGWGFDVRTYSDSRGLRDQIFNVQRIVDTNKDMYRSQEVSTGSYVNYTYGDDASDLQNDMQAKLDIDGKFTTFSLDLQANFGMKAINNSKRIFSWIRGIYGEREVYLNNFDPEDAQTYDWFTTDFRAMRREVIDSKGSDDVISRLINNYGTHFVEDATLGGCYDYYYSSVYDASESDLDVQATLNFAYSKKFSLKGSADYTDNLKKMSNEVIEKFSVKGGDNVDITNKVFAGTVTQADTDAWVKTLSEENKLELINFSLTSISELFPEEIADKIENYMARLYYGEVSVTRSTNDNR